jgi:hypothetical protein
MPVAGTRSVSKLLPPRPFHNDEIVNQILPSYELTCQDRM